MKEEKMWVKIVKAIITAAVAFPGRGLAVLVRRKNMLYNMFLE